MALPFIFFPPPPLSYAVCCAIIFFSYLQHISVMILTYSLILAFKCQSREHWIYLLSQSSRSRRLWLWGKHPFCLWFPPPRLQLCYAMSLSYYFLWQCCSFVAELLIHPFFPGFFLEIAVWFFFFFKSTTELYVVAVCSTWKASRSTDTESQKLSNENKHQSSSSCFQIPRYRESPTSILTALHRA